MQLISVGSGNDVRRADTARSNSITAERFSPLHSVALQLCDRLFAEYDVVRGTTFDLRHDAHPTDESRESIALTPAEDGAPLVFILSSFPGLEVHYGQWQAEHFPAEHQDGAAVNVDDEIVRLRALVEHVIAGQLTEELHLPWFGTPEMRVGLGPLLRGTRRHSVNTVTPLSRQSATEMLDDLPHLLRWSPWRRRSS